MEKCPNKGVNLIHLKQTAKQNTLQDEQNEKHQKAIMKAEKVFSYGLAATSGRKSKRHEILDEIIALETGQSDSFFYHYRPHRENLTTRFGSLFYNDQIVIPEAMRSTPIAMLHQEHVSTNKMDQSAEAFWWPGPDCNARSERKLKTAHAVEPQVRT